MMSSNNTHSIDKVMVNWIMPDKYFRFDDVIRINVFKNIYVTKTVAAMLKQKHENHKEM